MAKRYEGQAQFLVVYITEAHPVEGWATPINSRLTYIKEPVNMFARTQVANTCMSDLQIDMPCVVDDMNNTVARAYRAWPDRLYIIALNGDLAYVGPPGPKGFVPDKLEEALKEELARY